MAEGFLNARQAAAYVGYEPGEGPARTDRAMKCLYEFVRRHKVRKYGSPGRLLFSTADLDRAVGKPAPPANVAEFERMAELARKHARGERISA